MQTFYQESNSSDVFAHSPVVSESHFLNIPCPIHGGNIAFGTSQGETQMFGSQPLEFLELLWTKGERPEVKQHYLFCPVSYQLFKTAQQIKHGHFLSARPAGAAGTTCWIPVIPTGCWGMPEPHWGKPTPPAHRLPRKDLTPDRPPRPLGTGPVCLLSLSGEEILGLKKCLTCWEGGYPAGAAPVRMPKGLLAFQAGPQGRGRERRDACLDFKYLFFHALKL